MEPTQTYSFRYLPIRYVFCIIITFPTAIAVIISMTFALDAISGFDDFYILWIVGLLFMGFIVYCATKITKKNVETVRISDTALVSDNFGRISFSEIASYRIKSGVSKLNVDKPAPSLVVYRKDARKIRFDLNVIKYDDEIGDYMGFINDFMARIAAYENIGAQISASGLKVAPKMDHVAAGQALRRVEKSQKNAIRNTVWVFAIIALLYLIRLLLMF